MSNSEYRVVLQMLEDGKIDAEEAEKLLQALAPEKDSESGSKTVSDRADGANLSKIVKSTLSSLGDIGFLGWGPGQSYETEVRGTFDDEAVADSGPVTFTASAKNGRIEVKGWDSDEYRIVIRAKARGDRNKAREVAEDHCTVQQGDASLTVDGREHLPPNSSVALECYLPKKHVYDVDLITSNGRIEVEGLSANKVVAKTSNGRVACSDVHAADHIELRTSNGRVQADRVVGSLDVKTSNGRVVLSPGNIDGDSTYRAVTSNGKIIFDYRPTPGVGVDFDARASNGKVHLCWDDLELETDLRGRSRKNHVKGKTLGYQDRELKLVVDLQTTNGKILLGER